MFAIGFCQLLSTSLFWSLSYKCKCQCYKKFIYWKL